MLRIIKDRYRPLFCSEAFYLQNQKVFSEWYPLFKNLSSTEKVQAWALGLSLLRRPRDWFGGLRKYPFIESGSTLSAQPLLLKDLLTASCDLEITARFRELSFTEFLNCVQIKAIPETALRSLTFLMDQRYPLEVLYHVPTPQELLQIQIQGKRIISFNEDFKTWPGTLYHGRDFLSFMIHDLIHANHFFSTPEHRAGQLGFYRCIQMILQDIHLQELLDQNSVFKEAFEYIISDMNSHPVHLFKTLHARVFHALENEMKAISLWRSWTLIWSSEELTVISALQKINTQLFSDKDALKITAWSIALGHNSSLA